MINDLKTFVDNVGHLTVLTGAGCSLTSGIPTYRDTQGIWQRNKPIFHRDFINRHASRQRYWARSLAGWPIIAKAKPNEVHHSLKTLEQEGKISLLVTQNIDALHQRAGHKNVIDLHGRLDEVVCLECGHRSARHDLQTRLKLLNPKIPEIINLPPDGDADIFTDISKFNVPTCLECEGILKPNVVFFGDTVNKDIVQHIYQALSNSNGLLIIGSSLRVYSGFRFCKRAAQINKPIVSINPGETRGNELFTLTIKRDCVEVISELMTSLGLN
ncbi:MAG: NAD-dependent protein deacetylase [Candidatus Azotimanducaceae bacterium]|uniref:protein acetyllysine N-acetyltransferase n=1 Tax=OM182 bacterium TaxID=2510334 RepID=A0A520S063_9GAMM|nr:NAD-dependent deacetylase [Gammaproteobacteria bacterium]RZO75860.1 MAG: NAD-dependent protein deacetylase [OM182 bacterium]